MISRAHRFHGYGSLRPVYARGQTARGPNFGVRTLANPRRRGWRAAVVVSRKVNKSAVARNRLRRRLYAALRELGPRLNRPYDIVITVFNDNLLDAPPAKLQDQLQKQLHQLGLLDK